MNIVSEGRRKQIADQLEQKGKIFVSQLAEHFQVTPETIRRDLDEMEKQGVLTRVHGGAIQAVSKHIEPPFTRRQNSFFYEKQLIGKAAAETIADGDTIILDAGTTTLEFAKAIKEKKQLTILTNSIAAANTLNESVQNKRFDGRIIIVGGILNTDQQSISGSMAYEFLEQYRVDKAYISCGGVSDDGVTDYDVEEALLSRKMIKIAQANYLLADQSKLGKHSFSMIAPLNEFHNIITEAPCNTKWKKLIQENHINWILAREAVTIES